MLSDKKVFVTGAAGFIGSHLTQGLLKQGAKVIAFDNLITGHLANIHPFIENNSFEFIKGDLGDLELLTRIIRNNSIEVIFHLAALPSVPRSIDDPLSTHQANATGTFNILLAAKKGGVRRVVYASSSSVYGASKQLPKIETMPTQPISPYAASKMAGEMYCKAFSASYGLETVSLRYFNVFGPRQANNQYSGVIPIFISALLRNQPYRIFGDGNQSRDFTYVENVIEANILAAQAPDIAGDSINIACGKQTTINELEKALAHICGAENRKITYLPPRIGDIRHSFAEITKARKLLNYNPNVDLKEGLKSTVAWFKQYKGKQK